MFKFLRALVSNRVARYLLVNGGLSLGMTALVACLVASGAKEEMGWGLQALLTVAGVNAFIFLWRTAWILWALDRGMKITDKSDDYALERTTVFGWVVFIVLAIWGELQGEPLYENVSGPPVGWILTLVLWSPIIGVIGSSKGKLKATTPDGQNLAWPHMRKSRPSVSSTGVKDTQSEREQVEPSTSDEKQNRNRWTPQTWGNFSLVLIQGSILSLFQVGLWDVGKVGTVLEVCSYGFLLIGVAIFYSTTKLKGASIAILCVGLLLSTAFAVLSSYLQAPTFPVSERECANLTKEDLEVVKSHMDIKTMCKEIESARQGLSHKGRWLAVTVVSQILTLLLAWWASTKIKTTWRTAWLRNGNG